eukprot:3224921-Amphidinium_carterae.3
MQHVSCSCLVLKALPQARDVILSMSSSSPATPSSITAELFAPAPATLEHFCFVDDEVWAPEVANKPMLLFASPC